MTKFKLFDLVNGIKAFELLQKQVTDNTDNTEKTIGTAVKFKLARWIRLIAPEIQDFEKQRVDLAIKYGEEVLGEDKTPTGEYKVTNIPEFNKNINELLNTQIELSADLFALSELEQFNLKFEDILTIVPFTNEK